MYAKHGYAANQDHDHKKGHNESGVRPQFAQSYFQPDENEDKGVGHEGGKLPEGEDRLARGGTHTVLGTNIADHHPADDHGDDARGMELHGHNITAVGGDCGQGNLDEVVVDFACQVGNGQPDRDPKGCAKKNLAQEIAEHLQSLHIPALAIQGGNAETQAVSGDLDHDAKEHHGDAIVDEAFTLDDNAEPLRHGEFLEQCHHGNGIGGRQHGGGDQANLPHHISPDQLGDRHKNRGGEHHADDDAGYGKEQDGAPVVEEGFEIHVKCRLK